MVWPSVAFIVRVQRARRITCFVVARVRGISCIEEVAAAATATVVVANASTSPGI